MSVRTLTARESLALRLGWVKKGKLWLPPGVPDEPGQYMELPSMQHLQAIEQGHDPDDPDEV
jgi:hypothetical protein